MLVHLNGQIIPADTARVSVFDRGFLFGDGVYEVLRSFSHQGQRRCIGLSRHVRRLARSLDAVGIEFDAARLGPLSDELLDACELRDAMVYWQITRGCPDLATQPVRSHAPAPGMSPTIFGYARPLPALDLHAVEPVTKHAVCAEDHRWSRCDIKSTSLLGHLMLTRAAQAHSADEAILIRPVGGQRLVSEGSYANVALLTREGELVTPALDSCPMLAGITREILCELIPTLRQRPVLEAELRTAREIMLLGTTTTVASVVTLDGVRVGDGAPGPGARTLLAGLLGALARRADDPAGAPAATVGR